MSCQWPKQDCNGVPVFSVSANAEVRFFLDYSFPGASDCRASRPWSTSLSRRAKVGLRDTASVLVRAYPVLIMPAQDVRPGSALATTFHNIRRSLRRWISPRHKMRNTITASDRAQFLTSGEPPSLRNSISESIFGRFGCNRLRFRRCYRCILQVQPVSSPNPIFLRFEDRTHSTNLLETREYNRSVASTRFSLFLWFRWPGTAINFYQTPIPHRRIRSRANVCTPRESFNGRSTIDGKVARLRGRSISHPFVLHSRIPPVAQMRITTIERANACSK